MLLIAYETRGSPVKLVAPTIPAMDVEAPFPAVDIGPTISTQETHHRTRASEYILDVEWRTAVFASCIGRCKVNGVLTGTETDIEWDSIASRADVLTSMLDIRFNHLICDRLKETVPHDHWVIRWFSKNLGRLASMMYLMGHIREDIRCVRGSESLLTHIDNFIKINPEDTPGAHGKLDGAYLHYHTVTNRFIRAGKAVRRGGFTARHEEHLEGAKLLTADNLTSVFYTSYPSSTAANAKDDVRRGHFENLQQCIAIAFDRNCEPMVYGLT